MVLTWILMTQILSSAHDELVTMALLEPKIKIKISLFDIAPTIQ